MAWHASLPTRLPADLDRIAQQATASCSPRCQASFAATSKASQRGHWRPDRPQRTGDVLLRATTVETTGRVVASPNEQRQYPELTPENYYKLAVEGAEFFFARTHDDRLILSDYFVMDLKEGKLFKVTPPDWAPSTPRWYQELAWVSEYHGDFVNSKQPNNRYERIYLVPEVEDGSGLMKLDEVHTTCQAGSTPARASRHNEPCMQVFCVDWKTLRLRQEEVEYVAESADPREHILRIQMDRVTIHDQHTIPDIDDVCDEAEEAQRQVENEKRIASRLPTSNATDKETADPGKADPANDAELLDPTTARSEFEQDFASVEDTPESDAS